MGREVAVVLNGEKPAGYHNIEFSAGKLAGGVYYYKLSATAEGREVSEVQKLVVIK
jgi:hypothetical protein